MIYVDDMKRPARPAGYRGRGVPRWSHMFADTPAELAQAAANLGLNSGWLQHPGTHREHYDVTLTVRQVAIDEGAQRITYPRGVAELMNQRRSVCACTTLRDCRWAALAGESR